MLSPSFMRCAFGFWLGKIDYVVAFRSSNSGALQKTPKYDGEIGREEAERLALDWCITTWLAANPPCGLSKGLCSACGEPIGRVGEDSIPLLAGRESHAWVHHTCVDEWRRQRRRLAVAALAKMGVFCKAPEFEERKATT